MNDQTTQPSHEEIAQLAKSYWQEEGWPEGKATEHWERAERELHLLILERAAAKKATVEPPAVAGIS